MTTCEMGMCLNDPVICRTCMIARFNMHMEERRALHRSADRCTDKSAHHRLNDKIKTVEDNARKHLAAALLMGFDTGKHPTARRMALEWGLA